MSEAELERALAGLLCKVAPDVDAAALRPGTRLREDLEIDSFDFLQLVLGIQQTLGVEVSEADYARLATFGGAVEYLAARAVASPKQAPSEPPAPHA